jgi:hypothetical protein
LHTHSNPVIDPHANKIVYLKTLEGADAEEPLMRFRLVYEGELRPNQRDPMEHQPDRLAEHKQGIRKIFHTQLKQLWATNKFLKNHKMLPTAFNNPNYSQLPTDQAWGWESATDNQPMVDVIAHNYQRNGYRFVPLVREEMSLLCDLDILFLRRDHPGSVLEAGDLDNRIKTLVDCLRMPKAGNELRGNEFPGAGEDPFFCLLDDDKAVSGLAVQTDIFLKPPMANLEEDKRQTLLVITVNLRPYDVTMFNLSFS